MPQRPRRLAALVVAALPAALAIPLFVLGAHRSADAGRGPIVVTPAQALDRRAVPAEALVAVSGRLDPTRVAMTYGDHRHLFTLAGEDGLVLVCDRDRFAELSRRPGAQTLEGRIYDGGHYVGAKALPGLAIQQFAHGRLQREESQIRVLDLAAATGSARAEAWVAVGFGGVLTAGSAALFVLLLLGVLPRPSRASLLRRRNA